AGICLKSKTRKAMKAAPAKKPSIRIAVVESDPLRFVGFRALFDSETDFELASAALPDIGALQNIDLILLGNRSGQNLFDVMAGLKATRPDLRIIVTGWAWTRKPFSRRSPPGPRVTWTKQRLRMNLCRRSGSCIRRRSGHRGASYQCSSSEFRPLLDPSSRLVE